MRKALARPAARARVVSIRAKMVAILAALSAALSATAWAQAGQVGPAEIFALDPGFAELGALVEPVDAARLERAAFLASGLPPGRIEAYAARLDRELAPLRAKLAPTNDEGERAEAILGFLHEGILRAYRADASTLDGILDTGLFNCVSSAVLYAIAARSEGLAVAAAKTADHAFCTVLAGGRSVDVETTDPYGYDPGNKKEFKDSFGRVTGFAYVPPGAYGDRVAIDAAGLVGLILCNRAADLERAGRFAEAERMGADYASLCPGPDSLAFLADRLNNLIADLEDRRDYVRAAGLAELAAASLPGQARLADLARTAEYNLAASMAQAGNWAGAFDAALSLSSSSPSDASAASLVSSSLSGLAQAIAAKGDFAGARKAIADRALRAGAKAAAAAYAVVGDAELVAAVASLSPDEASAVANKVLAAGEVGAQRYAQAIEAIFSAEAGRLADRGDWLGAAAASDRGLAALASAGITGDGSLERLSRDLRHNYAVDAHNAFAKLYNSGDFRGARAVLQSALGAMPGDSILARDLAALGDR